MTRSHGRLVAWLPPIGLALMVTACTLPGPVSSSMAGATSAALTAEAAWAQQAARSPTPPPPDASATMPPAPTETPIPTLSPAATGAADCADEAAFVSDLTILDDTSVSPGEGFTKAWRIKNTGTCTWTTAYSLVFIDGNTMSGPASQSLAGAVAPGETVDISVELKAPVTQGVHRGNWKLRNSSGMDFGVGGGGSIYVQIVVGPTLTPATSGRTIYNLAENYCDAEWRSAAGVLPCPGTEGDPNGFVLRLEEPRFENGVVEDEPTLLTRPQMATDGVISGRFPALQVMSGYRFRTHIGCRYDSTGCNAIYQLNYRIDGGTLQNLMQWSQKYDGEWQKIDLDLTSLSGKSVEFVLAVASNGASSDDDAYWLNPKIIN